jgi:hypothetical protein
LATEKKANPSHDRAMGIVVLFLVLTVVAVAAPRYGVDSRAAVATRSSTPATDLARLRRWCRDHRRGSTEPSRTIAGGSTEDRRSAPAGSP